MAQRLVTERFYQSVIEKVIQSMRVPFRNQGMPQDMLGKIHANWIKNLQSALKSSSQKPKQRFNSVVIHQKPVPVPRPEQIKIKEESISESEEEILQSQNSSQYSASESEEDPAQKMFKQAKEEERKQMQRLTQTQNQLIEQIYKQEEKQEEISDDCISDQNTDILAPDVEDEMICMYEFVNRRGGRWKIRLENCILEMKSEGHHIMRLASGEFEFNSRRK